MEPHLSQLQDIVRLTIRRELEWSERRFKRVVMSHDASDNPAELYGADGKIYYRTAGGVGVEIGTSGGGSHSTLIQLDYASAGHTGFAGNPAVANQDMDQKTIYDSSDITLYDGSVISPELHFRVPLDEGFSGFKIDYHSTDGMLRFQDRATSTSVMTLSDAGKLVIWDDFWLVKGKEINFGTPSTAMIWQDAATEDLKFSDTVLGVTKTLSQLAAGGGAYLPLAGGTMDASAHIDMSAGRISDIGILEGSLDSDFYVFGSSTTSSIVEIMHWDYLNQRLDMNNHKITGLVAGAASTDAVRFGQLASYLPLAGGTMAAGNSGIDMNDGDIANVSEIRLEELGMVGPYMIDGMSIKSQSGVFVLAAFGSTDDTSGSLDLSVSLDMEGHTIHGIGGVRLNAATELTIATGIITVTQKYHKIDTESDGATDDLVTINGGTEGEELLIRSVHTDRIVVVKNGTGNILLGADRSLDNPADTLSLIHDGANWLETGFANNGA